MAWMNIFDLGEWDIYVQYNGVSWREGPDSTQYLVRAEDLHPDIGTVTVQDGVIVLDMENGSGGGGVQPLVVVMPKTPQTGKVRATFKMKEWEGGDMENASGEFVGARNVTTLVDQGGGQFSPEMGSMIVEFYYGDPFPDKTVIPGTLALGEGLLAAREAAGY